MRYLIILCLMFTSAFAADKAAITTTVARLNNFSEQLFAAALKENRTGDVLVQPLGIVQTLLALYANADGESAAEIAAALALNANEIIFAEKFLRARVQRTAAREYLNVWWLSSRWAWSENQPAELARDFFIRGEQLDFYHDPEKARTLINNWAARLGGRSSADLFALLPPTALPTTTQLLITQIEQITFTLPENSHVAQEFNGENFRAVELPVDEIYNLALFVPKTPADLGLCEKMWAAIKFDGWRQTVRTFCAPISVNTQFAWCAALRQLGVETVFSEQAQLPRLSPNNPPLSDIFQAVTLTFRGLSPAAENPPAAAFVLARPFIFIIRERATNLIVSCGRVGAAAEAPLAQTPINRNGYGAWNFGMDAATIRQTGAALRLNTEQRWQVRNVEWDGEKNRRAELMFNQADELCEIRLWLAEDASSAVAMAQLRAAENYLRRLGNINEDGDLTDFFARVSWENEKQPSIITREFPPSATTSLRGKLTVIRHPQLGWQVMLQLNKQ